MQIKDSWINLVNLLKNGWSIVLAVVNASKYVFKSWIKIVANELSDTTLFIICDSDDVVTVWCDCLSASQLCRSCAFVMA